MTSTNQTKDSGTESTLNLDLDDVKSLKYALFNELHNHNAYFRVQLSETIETSKISAFATDKMAEGQLILIKEIAFYRQQTNPGQSISSLQE
jgi:hypothetical protein